jgi:hypothetical protein
LRDAIASTRDACATPDLLGQAAKAGEEIPIHQLNEVLLVFRGDFKSAQTFSTGASTTLLTKIRGTIPKGLLRGDSARYGFELFQDHAFGQQFRENNRLFRFSRIKHVERDAGAAKLLQ